MSKNRLRIRLEHKLVWIGILICVTACQASFIRNATTAEADMSNLIPLPEPRKEGSLSLEEALALRRSVRDFSQEALTLEQIGQLLWSAQGMTDPRGYRTAPSAGALYPLELYAVLPDGVYHYDPSSHTLAIGRKGDLRKDLFAVSLKQQAVFDAPLTLVITAVYQRIEVKYGQERGPRYVHLEAGHAAQNVLLQCVALDLGAVPIGAFYDSQVQDVLGIPEEHQPLYLIPIGHSK